MLMLINYEGYKVYLNPLQIASIDELPLNRHGVKSHVTMSDGRMYEFTQTPDYIALKIAAIKEQQT